MLFSLILSTIVSTISFAAPMRPMTDLGNLGNARVAKNYQFYKKQFEQKGCLAKGSGHRILLTGFGLFSGVNYNISSAVVSSMASSNFWPAETDLENTSPISSKAHNGLLSSRGPGVTIVNRSLTINDKKFEICFVTVNVNWDFAAAVFIDQATQFKPELILMTGRGGSSVSLESGAINNATRFSGFDAAGKILDERNPKTENQPVLDGGVVLSDYSENAILPLSWNTFLVNQSITSSVTNLGYGIEQPTDARSENNYICNNVSFVLAHASQNNISSLVGGALVLPSPEFSIAPKVGFFHFPSTDNSHPNIENYAPQIFNWCSVIARAIVSQF